MIKRCPRCDSMYCCGIDYAEEMTAVQAQCDRLREALKKIEKHPNADFNVAIVQKEAPTIADIAHAALQEAGDE